MRLIVVVLSGLALLGASRCASVKLEPDTAMAAIEAQDYTGMVDGCGKQPIIGFDYCRVEEGSTTTKGFSFIGPPAVCKGEACVFIKVYKGGEVIWGGSIPKGKTKIALTWKDLTKQDSFAVGDRGFYPYTHEVKWIDKDGNERTSFSQGELVLRVYKKGYIPLHTVSDDPNFVWRWIEDGRMIRLTTGLRAFIGGQDAELN